MFAQILRQWFWDCYDHLLRLIVANVVLFLVIAKVGFSVLGVAAGLAENAPGPALLLLFALVALLGPVLGAVWFAGVGGFAELVTHEKDPGFREFLRGVKHHGFRVWKYLQVVVLCLAILAANVWFYVWSGQIPANLRLVGFVLAGLCFWIGAMLLAAALIGMPFLIRRGEGARRALKLGFVALLRYPGALLPAMLFLAGFWILGALFRFAGLVVFCFSFTPMFLNSIYDVLMAAEDAKAAAPEDDAESTAPATWKEREAADKAAEKRRMDGVRYNRTLRDVLRPWEG